MKNRLISFILTAVILLSLCSCKEDKSESNNSSVQSVVSSNTDDTKTETTINTPITEADYLNLLYGYYETNEAYVYISADYYEEKSKTEEYDYRYGDIGNIAVVIAEDGTATYEISVDMQFLVCYGFDGTQINTFTGEYTKKITKEAYDKIPLKTFTYSPPAPQPEVTIPEPDYAVPISRAKVGDIIYFGTCEQDGLTDNGPEKIQWRVLEKKDGRLFVLAEKVIAFQKYNKDKIHTNYPPKVTWEQCTLRTWLNNDFYSSAFSDSEKKKIPTVTVHTEGRNNFANTTGGNDTQDKVFCLSLEEAVTYLKTTEGAAAYATRQVLLDENSTTVDQIKNGVAYLDTTTDSYWLRTPGDYGNNFAMYIELDGEVNLEGIEVNISRGVRPAMYIETD